jgi:hypothetical protein
VVAARPERVSSSFDRVSRCRRLPRGWSSGRSDERGPPCFSLVSLKRRASIRTHKGRSTTLNLLHRAYRNRFRFSGRCSSRICATPDDSVRLQNALVFPLAFPADTCRVTAGERSSGGEIIGERC